MRSTPAVDRSPFRTQIEEALDLLMAIDQSMGYNMAVLRSEWEDKPEKILLAMNTIALIRANAR